MKDIADYVFYRLGVDEVYVGFNSNELMALIGALLGMGGYRTFEKLKNKTVNLKEVLMSKRYQI